MTILWALVSIFEFRFRSGASLELELVALRHQATVLRRQRPGGRGFHPPVALPDLARRSLLVKPTTVIRWLANLRILEVEEIKSMPYVPVSHPFVERLIGTIRREFLDHVLIWNAVDPERKLEEFRTYNEHRVHQSLNGHTPVERSGQPPPTHAVLDRYAWGHHCRGLFQICQSRRD